MAKEKKDEGDGGGAGGSSEGSNDAGENAASDTGTDEAEKDAGSTKDTPQDTQGTSTSVYEDANDDSNKEDQEDASATAAAVAAAAAEAAADPEKEISAKVNKQLFIRKDQEQDQDVLVEPEAFAEAFHGSGSASYSPERAAAAATTTTTSSNTSTARPTDETTATRMWDDSDPAAPSLRSSSSDSDRTASHAQRAHDKLRSYEHVRRTSYAAKLSSSSVYWRSVRELCHQSVAETARAEQMFRGVANLNGVYATFLRASCDNLLDDHGLPVVDSKKKKKLQESRSPGSSPGKGGGSRSGTPKSSPKSAAVSEAENEDDGGSTGSKHKVPPQSAFDAAKEMSGKTDPEKEQEQEEEEEEEEEEGGILDPLYESQGVMSERFQEFATFVEEEAVPEVVKIGESLELQLAMVEKVGDALVENMEAVELEVVEAWKNYNDVAEEALKFANIMVKRRGVHMASESDDSADDAFVESCEDAWVKEMYYRMSVAYLSACWDKTSAEMAKVFTALKREECSRRFRLRELLHTFLEKQDQLWLSLPPISAPLMKDLADKPRDPVSIETELQNSIRARASRKQKDEAAKKEEEKGEEESEEEEEDEPWPDLKGADPEKGNFALQSPLLSDILVKADLIEVKYAPYRMKSFKTVLAIVTSNSFLHIFDIPSSRYSTPTDAFHALVPSVEVPTEETTKKVNMAKHRRDWYKMLQPSDSFVLANSSIAFKNEKNAFSFEIVEEYVASTFGKSKRKMLMRVLSKDEEKAWIAAMKADK